MANVSRPLVGLLVSTLAFFAIWTVALKPGGSASGGGSEGLHSLSSAVAGAHHVAATSGAASAAESGVPSPSGSAAGHTTTAASTGSSTGAIHSSSTDAAAAQSHGATPSLAATAPAVASSQAAPTPTSKPSPVAAASQPGAARLKTALAAHEVVMLLFYNPSGADDQAVKQEVDAVRPRAGVLVLSAPITQLANYSSITDQVPVSQSPTLLFIDSRGQASALTGFSDSLEIAQRLTDTLAVR